MSTPKFNVGDDIFISSKHVRGKVSEIITGPGEKYYNYQCQWRHSSGIQNTELFPEAMLRLWTDASEFNPEKSVPINQAPLTLITQVVQSRIASIPPNEVLGGTKVTGGAQEMEKALKDRTNFLSRTISKERQRKAFSSETDFEDRMSARLGNFPWDKIKDAFDYSGVDAQPPAEEIEDEVPLKVVRGGKQTPEDIAIAKAANRAQSANPEGTGG